MAISLDEPTDDDVAQFNKAVANAKRLAADSRLLLEKDRTYSAIMLSVFATEELGKALITFWGVRNKKHSRPHPSHVEKQSATFALLAAVEALKLPKSRLAEIRGSGGGFHEIGPLSSQFAFARSGFFDNLRMTVTYADQAPRLPLDNVEDNLLNGVAADLLYWFELAGTSIVNGPAMELASTIFENDLGRM